MYSMIPKCKENICLPNPSKIEPYLTTLYFLKYKDLYNEYINQKSYSYLSILINSFRKVKLYHMNINGFIFLYKKRVYKIVLNYYSVFQNECKYSSMFLDDVQTFQGYNSYFLNLPHYEITLNKSINKNEWNIKEIFSCMIDIATFIIKMHNENIIHNDIKPENIMKMKNKWYLIDFGLSCNANCVNLYDMNQYGTLKYMPKYSIFSNGKLQYIFEEKEEQWKFMKDWYSYSLTMIECFSDFFKKEESFIDFMECLKELNFYQYLSMN